MPRKARLDAPGTLHHVIIRGIERRRIADDKTDRKDFVSRLGEIALETETSICAWSLMTNHAHILLRSGPAGLSHFLGECNKVKIRPQVLKAGNRRRDKIKKWR